MLSRISATPAALCYHTMNDEVCIIIFSDTARQCCLKITKQHVSVVVT